MSKVRASVVLLVLSALLTACSSGGSGPDSDKPQEIKPADYTAVLPMQFASQPGENRLAKDAGLLIAPHYTVRLEAIVIGDRLAEGSTRFEKGTTAGAATGHEFVLAQLSSDETKLRPLWTKNGDPITEGVSIALSIGTAKREVKLEKLPVAGDVLAVSVPKDEPVWLRLTDEKRTQSLNLRDGSRGDDAEEGFYRARTAQTLTFEYEKAGKVTVPGMASYNRKLTIELSLRNASLEPWLPRYGWAAKNTAWLQLSGLTASSDALLGYDLDDRSSFPIDFRLDAAKTFTLTLPDGKRVTPAGKSNLIPASLPSIDEYTIAYAVPTSFTKGTVKVTPIGPMKAQFKNFEPVLSWTTAPAAATVTITFPAG